MGMECEVFMGKEDTERQALNVYKMRLLGAKVHPVTSGTATLKDAVSETMREWTNRIADTHYVLGSVMVLTLSQPLSAISRQLSPKKSKNRCWKKKAGFQMQSLPV